MTIRIIPKIEIKNKNLIKGICFEGLRIVGNPNEFAINVGCIDEIDPYEYFKLKVENNDGNHHVLDRIKK